MELLQNPFYILQATPRDNRAKLAELAEDASFSLDPDFCQKARTELTNPRKRLSAEIAWFPGISPASVTELLSILDSDFTALKNVSEYSGLVRFNLLIAGLSRVHEAKGTNLAQWVLYIAQSFKEIEIIGLCKAINEDRSVSGFPEITDCSWIDNELSERNKTGRNIINQALKALPTDDRIATLTYIIESATDEGNKHAPVLIHDLIDDYEIESKAELEKGEAAIKALVEKIKIHAGSGASVTSLSAMVDELITTLESWDKTAQPIQVSKKSLGLNHDLSQRIAIMVRGLAIHLYNEYS